MSLVKKKKSTVSNMEARSTLEGNLSSSQTCFYHLRLALTFNVQLPCPQTIIQTHVKSFPFGVDLGRISRYTFCFHCIENHSQLRFSIQLYAINVYNAVYIFFKGDL